MKEITIRLGGVPLRLQLNHDNISRSFRKFRVAPDLQGIPVAMTPEEIARAGARYPGGSQPDYVELMELCPRTSDALLPTGRCLFHGMAFFWRGKVWIFTAPSGTGKTTQYILWKLLFGEEVRILNGDKPLLDFSGPEIRVHPTPWMGKEGMGRLASGPLGGIVLLSQGTENAIRRLPPKEAVLPVFRQFLFSGETAAKIHQVAELETRLLSRVPVWELVNRGDEASACLCRETLEDYCKEAWGCTTNCGPV